MCDHKFVPLRSSSYSGVTVRCMLCDALFDFSWLAAPQGKLSEEADIELLGFFAEYEKFVAALPSELRKFAQACRHPANSITVEVTAGPTAALVVFLCAGCGGRFAHRVRVSVEEIPFAQKSPPVRFADLPPAPDAIAGFRKVSL